MTSWRESDPWRWAQDERDVSARFPGLRFEDVDAGRWYGRLPDWPFDRTRPAGLDKVTGGVGLELEMYYPQSYPVVPPWILPRDPDPGVMHRAEHKWHLNGDGTLCLLSTASSWTGRESVTDLLLKAAGWRIEYELLSADLIEAMSERGIVVDAEYDHLIEEAACRGSASS